MTPTTLEGWMEILDLATDPLIRSFRAGDKEAYERHYDLWYWIQKRIITKYGENETTTK